MDAASTRRTFLKQGLFATLGLGSGVGAKAMSQHKNNPNPISEFDKLCIKNGHPAKSELKGEELRHRNRLEAEYISINSNFHTWHAAQTGIGIYSATSALNGSMQRSRDLQDLAGYDPYLPFPKTTMYAKRGFVARTKEVLGTGLSASSAIEFLSHHKPDALKEARQAFLRRKPPAERRDYKFSPDEIVAIEREALRSLRSHYGQLASYFGLGAGVVFNVNHLKRSEANRVIKFVESARQDFLDENKQGAFIDFREIKDIFPYTAKNGVELPALESIIPRRWLHKEVNMKFNRIGSEQFFDAQYFPADNEDEFDQGIYKETDPTEEEIVRGEFEADDRVWRPLTLDDLGYNFRVDILNYDRLTNPYQEFD